MDEKIERRLLRRVGLRKIDAKELAIERVRSGRGFGYRDRSGAVITDPDTRQRIADLVIPPAWSEVRIAEQADAHLQAVGRDEAGRLQYIYHPAWEQVRAARKVERLRHLGVSLAKLRTLFVEDLDSGPASRRSALAAAAILVDRLGLRAGHEAYADDEGGRGAATLLKRHVAVDGHAVRLSFRGKGGRKVEATIEDASLARVLGELKRVRGTRLFKAHNGHGYRPLTAEDLNEYLREASGQEVTAKDFRTFHASALALQRLCEAGSARTVRERRKCLTAVAREVATVLHNTPTVARASYIHPAVIDRFEAGSLGPALLRPNRRRGLTAAESALMRLLERVENGRRAANGAAKKEGQQVGNGRRPANGAAKKEGQQFGNGRRPANRAAKKEAPPVPGRGRTGDDVGAVRRPRD